MHQISLIENLFSNNQSPRDILFLVESFMILPEFLLIKQNLKSYYGTKLSFNVVETSDLQSFSNSHEMVNDLFLFKLSVLPPTLNYTYLSSLTLNMATITDETALVFSNPFLAFIRLDHCTITTANPDKIFEKCDNLEVLQLVSSTIITGFLVLPKYLQTLVVLGKIDLHIMDVYASECNQLKHMKFDKPPPGEKYSCLIHLVLPEVACLKTFKTAYQVDIEDFKTSIDVLFNLEKLTLCWGFIKCYSTLSTSYYMDAYREEITYTVYTLDLSKFKYLEKISILNPKPKNLVIIFPQGNHPIRIKVKWGDCHQSRISEVSLDSKISTKIDLSYFINMSVSC